VRASASPQEAKVELKGIAPFVGGAIYVIIPQNGIFAQGTHAHYFLELDLQEGIAAEQALASFRHLRAPEVSAGGVNFVLAFGASFWRAIAPDHTPADLAPFKEIRGGDGKFAPARQHDVWIWINGSTPDVTFDHARAAWLAVCDVATLAAEQPCFVNRDSRDLTGFIDGTANPKPLDAPNVAMIPPGLPGEGGSHVLAMRWVHDLESFHAQPTSEQERVFGRTKGDSTELRPDQMPPTAHIARVQVKDDEGELQIYRRSVPYGTVAEHGLYFVAFSADRTRFDRMLARMFGTAEDGLRDHLTDFSRPVSGAFYFAPSLTTLRELEEAKE
jgi:porphyrinogen peroxidase